MMTTLVVIPAHNEETKLGEVIDDLRKFKYENILVVDDGSVDKTSEVARKKKVLIVRHCLNRGLGAALGTGFEYARRHDFDCLITFDADGQHQASDLGRLLGPIESNKADVVIGNRLTGSEKFPLGRLIINYVSNLATIILYQVWATDTLSGLRAFNRRAINDINIRTDRMEVSNEFFMEIKRNNLKFTEVPIKPVYTDYSQRHSHNLVSLSHSISIGKAMLLRLFR